MKKLFSLVALLLALCIALSSCAELEAILDGILDGGDTDESYLLDSVPEFDGDAFVSINENTPFFTEDEITDKSFESYSELDSLGRCGVAFASVGLDLMPSEERGSIGSVKPSGWQSVKYDIVDGKYLYNRCLTGRQVSIHHWPHPIRYCCATFSLSGCCTAPQSLPLEGKVACRKA